MAIPFPLSALPATVQNRIDGRAKRLCQRRPARSASAAELVAAALQENGRATVMGQRSFGKGSVQSIISLGADIGALRLTTALYHGPSGRTVQRTGVGPDIELVVASCHRGGLDDGK